MFVSWYLHNHTTSPYIVVFQSGRKTTFAITTTLRINPIDSYKVGLVRKHTILCFGIWAVSRQSYTFMKADIVSMIEVLESNLVLSQSIFPLIPMKSYKGVSDFPI